MSEIFANNYKSKVYNNVLSQVMDDKVPPELVNGEFMDYFQAFSMKNFAKMVLATQNISPGTWLGVGAVAHTIKHLNRLFRPLCDDFQVAVLNDGNVFLEKIFNKMCKFIDVGYSSKEFDLTEDNQQRFEVQEAKEVLFFDEIRDLVEHEKHWRVLR